jgi:hypothetical protein
MAFDNPRLAETRETTVDDGLANVLTAGEIRDGEVVHQIAAAFTRERTGAPERAMGAELR